MTNKAVVSATTLVFLYLLLHCAALHYTFRNVLLCFDKYRLNQYNNSQAADVFRSSMTFYTIRSLLNVINVFVGVNTLTALLMTFVNGTMRSQSRCVLVRGCCDVRDSLAMYLGCSVVLTVISCICRKVEIFVLILTPYDTVECCGAKNAVYLKGRLDNPEFSANAVSRFVGFSIIDSLMTGFKGILMTRLFEFYDDLSQIMDLMAFLHKRQQEAAAASAIAQVAPVEAPKPLSTNA